MLWLPQLPGDFEVIYENVSGEVVVGGVFLRLLIKQPNWAFRKPKEFLVAIMDKYIQLASKAQMDADTVHSLEQVTEALTALLMAQPDLSNHVPQLGHLHKLVAVMKRPDANVQSSILRICNVLSVSQVFYAHMAAIYIFLMPLSYQLNPCSVHYARPAAFSPFSTRP